MLDRELERTQPAAPTPTRLSPHEEDEWEEAGEEDVPNVVLYVVAALLLLSFSLYLLVGGHNHFH